MTSVLELRAPHFCLLDTMLIDKYRKVTGQPLKQSGENFAQHPCCSFSLSSAVHGIYSRDKNHVMVWLMPLPLLLRTDLTFFSVKTQEPLKPSALSGKPVWNSHQVFSLWSTVLFLAPFHFVLYVYKLEWVLEKKEHRSQSCLVCSYLTGVNTMAFTSCIKTLAVDEAPCQT